MGSSLGRPVAAHLVHHRQRAEAFVRQQHHPFAAQLLPPPSARLRRRLRLHAELEPKHPVHRSLHHGRCAPADRQTRESQLAASFKLLVNDCRVEMALVLVVVEMYTVVGVVASAVLASSHGAVMIAYHLQSGKYRQRRGRGSSWGTYCSHCVSLAKTLSHPRFLRGGRDSLA